MQLSGNFTPHWCEEPSISTDSKPAGISPTGKSKIEGRAKMDIIKTIAFLGTIILFFVLGVSTLSASSESVEALAEDAMTEERRKAREGGWLLVLNFLVILAILVWRVS